MARMAGQRINGLVRRSGQNQDSDHEDNGKMRRPGDQRSNGEQNKPDGNNKRPFAGAREAFKAKIKSAIAAKSGKQED